MESIYRDLTGWLILGFLIAYGLFVMTLFSLINPGFIIGGVIVLLLGLVAGVFLALFLRQIYQYRLSDLISALNDRRDNLPHMDFFGNKAAEEINSLKDRLKRIVGVEDELLSKSKEVDELNQRLEENIRKRAQFSHWVEEIDTTLESSIDICRELQDSDIFAFEKQLTELSRKLTQVEKQGEEKRQDDNIKQKLSELRDFFENQDIVKSKMIKFQEVINNLSEQLEQQVENVEKIAINTGIEGAKLGDAGRPITIIADDIQLEADNFKEILETLDEKVKELNKLEFFEGSCLETSFKEVEESLQQEARGGSTAIWSQKILTQVRQQLDDLVIEISDEFNVMREKLQEQKTQQKEIDFLLRDIQEREGSALDETEN